LEEKRRFHRLHQEMPVRHRLKTGNDVEQTKARDISTGGLCIGTDSKLDVGSKLDIEVNIGSVSKPYYAVGEVVWLKKALKSNAKKFDMGVKFLRVIAQRDSEGF